MDTVSRPPRSLIVGERGLRDQAAVIEASVIQVMDAIDRGLKEVARFVVLWHIEQFNRAKTQFPYHLWIQENNLNAVIWPWLGGKEEDFLREHAMLLFAAKPGYGSEWTMPWNAPRLARLMTELYRELGEDESYPELSEVRAYTLRSHLDDNILLKFGDAESALEASHKVGGYFD